MNDLNRSDGIFHPDLLGRGDQFRDRPSLSIRETLRHHSQTVPDRLDHDLRRRDFTNVHVVKAAHRTSGGNVPSHGKAVFPRALGNGFGQLTARHS